jgi:DNA-directed RNA polymerase specialized sigma24 family protein
VAATALDPGGVSYEEFVRLHAEEFRRYLSTVLGRAAEDRGGRVAVDDALQEGLLRIHAEWPELLQVRDEERDRRLYRCLRDAAGEALRAEHGRREHRGQRPRIVSVDFGALHDSSDAQPMADRELTAAVLGAMARELAGDRRDAEARAMLDRAVLMAGLRALTEREAVVLIAADYLGYDQHQLAERLGMGFAPMRRELFDARNLFYTVVRHAAGIEVEQEERARLVAYLAGELTGKERWVAGRHLRHCEACQALEREQRVFGRDAFGVLSPLPFVFGAKVLVRRSGVKASILGVGGGAGGLLAQAGAAKALAIVVGVLGVGVGASAWLAERHEQPAHHDRAVTVTAGGVVAPADGMWRKAELPSVPNAQHKNTHKKTAKKKLTSHNRHRSSSTRTASSDNAATPPSATTSPPPATTSPPSTSGQQATPGSSSTGSGSGSSSSGGDGEFFGG